MSAKTGIAWTDSTWNPIRGCSRVSEGCRNCYAERVAVRFSGSGQPYEGLASRETWRWTGEVRLVEERLDDPLRWRKPRRIFVNSMSDLFHEQLSDEQIDRVFAVMALAPDHTFQVLTKRPERMRAYLCESGRAVTVIAASHSLAFDLDTTRGKRLPSCVERTDRAFTDRRPWYRLKNAAWPLPNVWLGISVEDQETADERIPLLLRTPAAVRFASYEPALGPVDFTNLSTTGGERWNALDRHEATDAAAEGCCGGSLNWIIVGGESGPGARPFDVAWAYSTIEQARAAGISVWVKQLGARPYSLAGDSLCDDGSPPVGALLALKSRGGSDPAEWPESLRVQEFPA